MKSTTCTLLALASLTTVLSGQGAPGGRGRIGGPGSGPTLPPPPIDAGMSAADLTRGLDGYVEKLAASGDFAGVVIVSKDGAPVFEKGYGLADRDKKIANTPDLRFNVASIGKAFTRTAIAQLAGEGKLALSDTIGARLPDYPNAAARSATIEQLLTHAVGVVDIFDPRSESRPDVPADNAGFFKMVPPEPLLFAPGAERDIQRLRPAESCVRACPER